MAERLGQRVGGGEQGRRDALDRPVQDDDGDVVAVAGGARVERVGVEGAVVDLVAGHVVGIERDADPLAVLAAVRRGEEHRRRDQRARAVQPGAVGVLRRRDQAADVRVAGSVDRRRW